MERRALLAAALSVLVIVAWQYFFLPSPELEESSSSSEARTESNQLLPKFGREDAKSDVETGTITPLEQDSVFASTETTAPKNLSLPEFTKIIETKHYTASFSSDGGGPKSWKLKDYTGFHQSKGIFDSLLAMLENSGSKISAPPVEPMELFSGGSSSAISFGFGSFRDDDVRYGLVSVDSRHMDLVGREGKIEVKKHFEFDPDSFLVKLSVTILNASTRDIAGRAKLYVAGSHDPEKLGTYAPVPNPSYVLDGKVEHLDKDDLEDGPISLGGDVAWAGVNDKYFLRAIILVEENGQNNIVISPRENGAFEVGIESGVKNLPPNGSETLNYELFLGPKQSELLSSLGRELEQSLDFGMFGVFAEPLLLLLNLLYGFTNSYGLSIILLTFIIKTVFFPLMVKQLESAQKMKEFQPQMAELRERFKDDKNRLNQEMMKFMQENKVNPLGGCLPVLLQMPIWFALYRVLLNSIELYHTPFLYFPDLSDKDPYGLSPLLLGVLMFVQQKMTPAAPGMDPTQAKMMQYLPLIFAAIMFTLPSGLVTYILVNTSLTIAQQWYIKKKSERNKDPATIGVASGSQ